MNHTYRPLQRTMKSPSIHPLSNYDSYPPPFRPNSTLNNRPTTTPEPNPNNNPDPIPVIDFQDPNHHDDDAISEACQNWGVFRLVNHGIPNALLNQLHARAQQLFSLPFHSKHALKSSAAMAYFWGTPALTPTGQIIEKGPTDMKWFEGFNVVLNQLSQLQVADDHVLHDFRLVLDEYGRHQSRLATTIFKAMAENLNLDQNQYESYLLPSTASMRIYRYLQCPLSMWGLDAHTDSSVLTILTHDEVGGFQVCRGDDEWIDVKPIPSTLVVILGDLIQAMSDDKYKSVQHRVKANEHKERISVGYFVFPAVDAVIQSSKYKPFTYADFRAGVQQDLKTIGYKKVGLGHFRLTLGS